MFFLNIVAFSAFFLFYDLYTVYKPAIRKKLRLQILLCLGFFDYVFICILTTGMIVFTPGQFVVYPAQGVGVIESIESQEMAGVLADFYIVRIVANNITVMVPVKSAKTGGLRELSSKAEAAEVLDFLQNFDDTKIHAGQNWNRRQREYTERLKSGTLQNVATVLRELILISSAKELSFGEKRLQEQAMSLLCVELGQVLEQDNEEVKTQIESYYAELLAKPEEEAAVKN